MKVDRQYWVLLTRLRTVKGGLIIVFFVCYITVNFIIQFMGGSFRIMASKKCTWLSELMSVLNLIQMNTSDFYFNLKREYWIFIFYLFLSVV